MAPSLKDKAEHSLKSNPSAVGDPVSLKAETSNSEPTDKDEPNKGGDGKKKTLKQVAEDSNPTMLGDPVSLKAETSDSEPTDDDRGASDTERTKKRESNL